MAAGESPTTTPARPTGRPITQIAPVRRHRDGHSSRRRRQSIYIVVHLYARRPPALCRYLSPLSSPPRPSCRSDYNIKHRRPIFRPPIGRLSIRLFARAVVSVICVCCSSSQPPRPARWHRRRELAIKQNNIEPRPIECASKSSLTHSFIISNDHRRQSAPLSRARTHSLSTCLFDHDNESVFAV